VGDGLDFAQGSLFCQTIGERDLEVFALPDVRDRRMAETVQRSAHRLTLRIEDRGLQRDENACFHGKFQLSHAIIDWQSACLPTGLIGVFDSGIGGLTVLQALRKRLPRTDFVYLADSARLPYGARNDEEIRSFATENAAFLYSLGAEAIVIACNTASAIALADVRLSCPVPVWGMVDAGVEVATRATCSGRVAVIATQATIRSGVFQRRLEARGLRVWAQACPALVRAAEDGTSDAEVLARHYLHEMPRVDTLLLGCTHFSLLRNAIERVVGPRVRVVDGTETVAAKVAAQVEDAEYGSVRYYSSGERQAWSPVPQPHRRSGSADDLVVGAFCRNRTESFLEKAPTARSSALPTP
jgi:glutamate racemase